ncbi:hypothetical protein FO519_004279 [Halicephalobus sp. NKZ332]|nr:hypothetical protein FO519_004279 [Halicephalobus sp. NKZ332]
MTKKGKEELARKHHARYRSDQYAKLQQRKSMLRECQFSKAFLKAAVLIDSEKNFLRRKGIVGSQQFLEEYKKQRSQSLVPQSGRTESTSSGDRGGSLESKNPPLPTFASTSVSYTSNIDLTAKPAFNIGGSLPASNSHTPLQKTDTALPITRISLAHTPLSKHEDGGLNLTDTSFINKVSPLLTSTPIASPTKPLFGPSNSTSTDSGKFSLQGDKSDADVPKKAETVTTPIVTNQNQPSGIFGNLKEPGPAANFSFKSPTTPKANQNTVKPPNSEQPSQPFSFKPSGTPQAGQGNVVKPQNPEPASSVFSKPSGTQQNPSFSFKPSNTGGQAGLFTSTTTSNPFSSTSTTATASSSLFSAPKTTTSNFSDSFEFVIFWCENNFKLSILYSANNKCESIFLYSANNKCEFIFFYFNNNKCESIFFYFNNYFDDDDFWIFVFREYDDCSTEFSSNAVESLKDKNSQKPSSLPNAAKWLILMNKMYHQFEEKISVFANDKKNDDLKKKIRIGTNDFIDRNLQLYENNEELNTVFGNFMIKLKKIVIGEITEELEENFSINMNNEGEKLFFMECLTKRILNMIKIDKLLIPNAVILHGIISREVGGFAEFFRCYVASNNYLLQLRADMFVKLLSKSLKAISDPDDRYRYILHSRLEEKQVFKLFVCIEKQKVIPQTKVSELAGQKLLWAYCQAYNELPQVPMASLTGMIVILKNAQDVFNVPTSPYFKEFAHMMMKKLSIFLKEDVSHILDEIIKKINCENLRNEIKQCHECARENAEQYLKGIGTL